MVFRDLSVNARAPARAARSVRRARAPSWSSVRVEDVCVHDATCVSDMRAICAAVCLPGMLPTEVVVELALWDAEGSIVGPTDARRMWSEQAYDLGRFMFVARVSPAELAQTVQATVTVRPGARGRRGMPIRATLSLPPR